ncbi:MAG: hypothetical protein GQ582_02300 [Methyloprofundus sp.]|nr:hypothetical protein [Methyloprofundus sp.]
MRAVMMDRPEKSRQLLLDAFINPNLLKGLPLEDWELLIRCAGASKLVAALGDKIAVNCPTMLVPEKVLDHFQAAQQLVNYRKQMTTWEMHCLNRALINLDIDIVLLKGAAYIASELPFANGRTLSDIDILVAKENIEEVEKLLSDQGWITASLDEYDDYYYRTWMHEIPPMRHRERYIEVDIHHSILPLTSRLSPDPKTMLSDAVLAKGGARNKVFSPVDMVLHSVVHLFHDAELNLTDFRDLVDLHELFSYFSKQDDKFWEKLDSRAEELSLYEPLYYALYFSKSLLKTSVPAELLINKNRPNFLPRVLMEYLVPLSILPEDPDFMGKKVAFARWLLYVRSHYLRMPMLMLLQHLMKKSQKRFNHV